MITAELIPNDPYLTMSTWILKNNSNKHGFEKNDNAYNKKFGTNVAGNAGAVIIHKIETAKEIK